MAFEVLDDLTHFIVIGALHDQRSGAEHFSLQRGVSEKILRLADEQMGLALVGCFTGQTNGRCLGMLDQRADAGLVGTENPGREHGLRGAATHNVGCCADETIEGRPLSGDHQTRVGAELTGALGQRCDEALSQCFTASLQGGREQQHRIDRTHFRVHRDRFRTCLRRLAQGDAATA
ncbi:hypothetical protein D3C85_1348360 [compost metagenome]